MQHKNFSTHYFSKVSSFGNFMRKNAIRQTFLTKTLSANKKDASKEQVIQKEDLRYQTLWQLTNVIVCMRAAITFTGTGWTATSSGGTPRSTTFSFEDAVEYHTNSIRDTIARIAPATFSTIQCNYFLASLRHSLNEMYTYCTYVLNTENIDNIHCLVIFLHYIVSTCAGTRSHSQVSEISSIIKNSQSKTLT